MRSYFSLLCLSIVLLCLFACEQREKDKEAIESTEIVFTDDMGTTIHLSDSPRRVMALASSLTEVLAAVADSAQIVAVTQTDDFPEWVKGKPVVNSYPLDLEKLLVLQPDLILTMEGMTAADDLQRIRELGLPIYEQRYRTVQDVLDGIRDVGVITGNSERAALLADSLELWKAELEAKAEGRERPSVLAVTWSDPIYVHGKNTLTTDKLQLAGARNAVDTALGAQYPALSREYVLQLDPDVIFGGSFEKMDSTFFSLYPELRRVKAYRDRRIYATDDNLTTRPGPRVLESVEEFRQLIHDAK